MTEKKRPRSSGNRAGAERLPKQILSPVDGGKTEKIQPLLQHPKPFARPGSLSELLLLLKNKTGRRVEGWLTITPPRRWTIEPGKRLMIAIRPEGTILAEFYLSTPLLPGSGPHLLQITVVEGNDLLAEAAFDLRAGLLFPVNN